MNWKLEMGHSCRVGMGGDFNQAEGARCVTSGDFNLIAKLGGKRAVEELWTNSKRLSNFSRLKAHSWIWKLEMAGIRGTTNAGVNTWFPLA